MNTTLNNTTPATPNNRLQQTCMMIQLSISIWTARKLDKKATAEVAANHQTAISVGRYNKRLLPADAPSYEKLKRIAGEIRAVYYANSLPWNDGAGARIISSANFLSFAEKIRPLLSQFEAAKKEFVADYPTLRENAKAGLNGLYNPHEYPDHIESKFSVSLHQFPITTNVDDFRVHLSENEISLMQQSMSESVANAMKDAWSQLHTALHAMHERLSQPEAIFRDSLFGNLKELVEILPALNLTNDPALTEATDRIKNNILSFNPEQARTERSTRKTIADEADRISKAMSGFFS